MNQIEFSPDLLHRLASHEVQQYITDHEHTDVQALVLKEKLILGVPAHIMAGQLMGRRKAKNKLPDFFAAKGIVYPHSLNLEQSSSSRTAEFKQEIIRRELNGNYHTCADLTGGFGVDSFYLATIFDQVAYVEPDASLVTLANHNHQLLGASNIRYRHETAEEFLSKCKQPLDLIYLDPSRRDEHKGKIFKLADCSPDITVLQDPIRQHARMLMVKTSPLLDITRASMELSHINAIYIVSVNNECKEVLYLCTDHADVEPVLHTVNLQENSQQKFSFTRSEEGMTECTFSEPRTFLYEPNASILKGGAFKLIATRCGLAKLQANTHLYTSDTLVDYFPGRTFRVIERVKPYKSHVRHLVPKLKANVLTRNYPLTADQLKKACGVNDGGDHYIIGCTSLQGKHVLLAERLS
jgi:hypothetical protein